MKNITITILSILLLITGGYLLYDKVLMEEDNQNINNNENNNTNVDENNNYQNPQEYVGFVNPEEHIEIEKSIKSKLVEVFEFVYNYNKSKFHGNYCIGGTDKNDTIKISNDNEPQHKYNIASTEYSSFKEMMDYLKTYMTPNIIYNNDKMTIDNFVERDGKLYCPYFETNKGDIYEFKNAEIKYSKPYETVIYVTMETTLVFDNESTNELFDVTFTKKNNNWIISSYNQFKYS